MTIDISSLQWYTIHVLIWGLLGYMEVGEYAYQRRIMGNVMNKDKKLVQLYLAKDKWDLLKTAADSVDEPLTVWIRRALFGALRNWDAPTLKKKNWPKCSMCGKQHDEQEHYSLEN